MIPVHLRLIREINRLYSIILRLLHFFTPQATAVYMFHDIKDSKAEVETKFAISLSSFEKFLLDKINNGFRPLTFIELSVAFNRRMLLKRKTFMVTFDDANESVYSKAYPFLQSNNIPFIIFITAELIGKPNYLNPAQIKEMVAGELCTVGSHAMHHVMFRYLSTENVSAEYRESKLYLERLTGKQIECFAFPYGRLIETSFQNIRLLKESEYNFGFSAISGSLKQKWISGKYFLPRINVSEEVVSD